MSAISLNTIHTFERETSSFRLSLTGLLGRFSGRISPPNWIIRKLTNWFSKLYKHTDEIQTNFNDIGQKEAKKILKISSTSIRRFIKLKEDLEKANYFDNEELKDAVKKCLKSFYLLEAKAKKATFPTVITNNAERAMKVSLSAHSKGSLVTKLSELK